jgi:hypothetical protein
MGVMDRVDRGGGRSACSSPPAGLEVVVACATLLAAPACVEDHEGAGTAREEEVRGGTTVEPRAAMPREPALHCDGEPLPPCDGPFTGTACDLPCVGGGDSLACGVARTCHSDGRTYGYATRNAVLYEADADGTLSLEFDLSCTSDQVVGPRGGIIWSEASFTLSSNRYVRLLFETDATRELAVTIRRCSVGCLDESVVDVTPGIESERLLQTGRYLVRVELPSDGNEGARGTLTIASACVP